MGTSDRIQSTSGATTPTPRFARERRPAWLGGGTDGNEQLTAMAGVVLLVLLAVIGVTILRIGQLISVHLFVGWLLIGPVLLKMATTGYRFTQYYTGDPTYRHKGPPELGLRLIAPIVVLSTVIVFVSGVVLMFNGPSNRGQMLLIHKVSFIVWVVFTALHVLGHLPRLGKSLRVAAQNAEYPGVSPGSAGRWLAMAGALVGGLVLAVVLIPHFAAWTAAGALAHHHRG
jgi:hypothetical protein